MRGEIPGFGSDTGFAVAVSTGAGACGAATGFAEPVEIPLMLFVSDIVLRLPALHVSNLSKPNKAKLHYQRIYNNSGFFA